MSAFHKISAISMEWKILVKKIFTRKYTNHAYNQKYELIKLLFDIFMLIIIFSKNFIVTLFWNRKTYILCFLHSYAMKISVFIRLQLYIWCNDICNKLVAQYKYQTIQSDQCLDFDGNLWFNTKSIFERFQRTPISKYI